MSSGVDPVVKEAFRQSVQAIRDTFSAKVQAATEASNVAQTAATQAVAALEECRQIRQDISLTVGNRRARINTLLRKRVFPLI